ncbi:unnamed protein product [marine sediment metagenome]|uniref:Uncharacterized protein n=1 Tax=marine sediment metagenome TaxID=412755 RepID=X0Z718_9ZZZZ
MKIQLIYPLKFFFRALTTLAISGYETMEWRIVPIQWPNIKKIQGNDNSVKNQVLMPG